jgi:hypothetical protein
MPLDAKIFDPAYCGLAVIWMEMNSLGFNVFLNASDVPELNELASRSNRCLVHVVLEDVARIIYPSVHQL